jgi:hypothetical protein
VSADLSSDRRGRKQSSEAAAGCHREARSAVTIQMLLDCLPRTAIRGSQ